METFNGYDNWKCTPPDNDEAYENMLENFQEWTPEQVRQYCYMTRNEKLWEKLLEDIAEAEIERLSE